MQQHQLKRQTQVRTVILSLNEFRMIHRTGLQILVLNPESDGLLPLSPGCPAAERPASLRVSRAQLCLIIKKPPPTCYQEVMPPHSSPTETCWQRRRLQGNQHPAPIRTSQSTLQLFLNINPWTQTGHTLHQSAREVEVWGFLLFLRFWVNGFRFPPCRWGKFVLNLS